MDIRQIAHEIIQWGTFKQVQDIYILPKQGNFELFSRKNHSRKLIKKVSIEEGNKLIVHFKFVGGMDIGEKRKPQLGSVSYTVNGETQRLRLSSVGDYYGRESLVLRFLYATDKQKQHFLLPKQIEIIKNNSLNRGLYLFSGPVGSGKTTIMYHLAKQKQNFPQLICIEDPVEIEEPSFLQLQTNEKIDLTYDALIKLCLRHRPDLLIIGEIRDQRTAQAAIRAALTGHTVFATLHARNISGVYNRLLELGIQKELLRECLKGIIYQQLLPCNLGEKGTKGTIDEAILFDYTFQINGYMQNQWIRYLRKVWAYGFISKQTYQKAKTE